MESKVVSTIVAANGEAEANNDLATFNLSLGAEDTLVSTVKLRIKNKITALDQSLKAILETHNVEIVKDSMCAQVGINPKTNYNTNLPEFQAVYSLSFQIDNLDKVNQIYNELSTLHEVTVGTPIFTLKNCDILNKKALENAWEKVSERFLNECEILKLNPEHYEIITWGVFYPDAAKKSNTRTQTYHLVDADDVTHNNVTDITPGLAKVLVNLSVSYIKKV